VALINCWECSGNVSSLAASCPHCGAPQQLINCHECQSIMSMDAARCSTCLARLDDLNIYKEKKETEEERLFRLEEESLFKLEQERLQKNFEQFRSSNNKNI
jgi:hypothetical protein